MSTAMTPTDIQKWYECEWAKRLLKCGGLVESDSHEPQEDKDRVPLMTKDRSFYFIPCYADCVTHSFGDRKGTPDPDRPRWSVEVLRCYPSNHRDEPDDFDLEEIVRADSLIEAITATRHWILDEELECAGMALWVERELLESHHDV